MSHFSTVRTRLINRECLVQALEDLKLQPKVYSSPQPLTGYYGDSQGQSAEIVVAGSNFNARADMGFKWTGAEYEMIQDEYEIIRQLGGKFYATKLMPAYGRRMVMAKVTVPLPTAPQIQEHLDSYLQYLGESAQEQQVKFTVSLTVAERESLARAALGLTLEEISDFLRLTVKERLSRNGITIDATVTPLAVQYKTRLLSQMGIELGKPATIPFGGLDLLREWLNRRRRLFTQEARLLHLPQPKGVLLAGVPGTGKTLLAKNIANILNLPLLQLDIASLLGSLVGESEGNVKRALKTAEAIAPCVLWVDEIEKALSGSGDTSGVSQRILGSILTFMSECTAGVFVVATCNDISALPPELKRKGRFDENFFVDPPTEPERAQILSIHLHRFGIAIEDEYLEAVAANTAKFSGAELETLAAEAALLAFDEGRPQQVTLGDLEACRQTITPLAVQDAAAVERMREWAKTARAASSAIADKPTQSLKTARFRNLN
ncbi:AAA family ATPase [Nostoc sp. FACHB-152]|uniref:AAA family ATPase n=1 Tax=Nostoc sp. FACHB-152 TaxID=2692837 RepID=UPI0016861F75|nr:AAA family ATPase [Nostoc sp. FACHB-152]MBD2451976.1 AAA family ATPase [Nostoc sp. FACHB-152]